MEESQSTTPDHEKCFFGVAESQYKRFLSFQNCPKEPLFASLASPLEFRELARSTNVYIKQKRCICQSINPSNSMGNARSDTSTSSLANSIVTHQFCQTLLTLNTPHFLPYAKCLDASWDTMRGIDGTIQTKILESCLNSLKYSYKTIGIRTKSKRFGSGPRKLFDHPLPTQWLHSWLQNLQSTKIQQHKRHKHGSNMDLGSWIKVINSSDS